MRTKKRGNGEGSLFQRRNGVWAAIVTAGYDATGKRRRKTVYGKTKREVQDKLVELQHRLKIGTLTDSSGLTVAKYLDRWLEGAVRESVRPSTHERYGILIRNQINPYIGGMRIDKLTAINVQSFYSSMADDGVSPRLRQFTHSVLRRALKQATRWGLLPRNVCELVSPPRVPEKEFTVLTAKQASDLIAAAESDRLQALYILAVTTGMRQGELFGLKWSDIDLEAGTLSVKRTTIVVGGKVSLGEPKTKKSKRRIDLPAVAVEALWKHRTKMLSEGNAAVEWVFCAPEGGLLRRYNFIRRSFEPLLERAELPKIRFHDLRHTAATLLLSEGVHPKVVQERLGHSKISTTLDTYSHVVPSMQREAADKLDKILAS